MSINDLFICDECKILFKESYLKQHFDVNVCNCCRDPKDKHSLITRTQAKDEYLLKDCDLDHRQPPLKFILKKNPNPLARHEMRLYLQVQVEERALQVWESEENLIKVKEERFKKRKVRKQKEFDKKMKSLRMSVRSSLYQKSLSSHTHDYNDEVYNQKNNNFEKKCKTCNYVLVYEKM